MSNTVIKVEGLSKRYQLGTIGYGSLQHDLKAWWAKARGKEDPNARIGEKSRLDLHGEFWALRDVAFAVEQGDRLGIMGRNGAGKSTLLKLLSRVTSPTTGSIKVRGRIASLLEVGTGFHPELTGRENVFLNGAILGMKRREIQTKFDEIVEFAGVHQFIDTPVKRYSSGMYVRLAFSVAAHLDSEILIIDEVLAVGDAEFQKKCLGKMEDVSKGHGRTILFVSHHIASIKALCNKGLFLADGQIKYQGTILPAIESYYSHTKGPESGWSRERTLEPLRGFKVIDMVLTKHNGIPIEGSIDNQEELSLTVELDVHEKLDKLTLGFVLYSGSYEYIYRSLTTDLDSAWNQALTPGLNTIRCKVPVSFLKAGTYAINLDASIHNVAWIISPEFNKEYELKFEVHNTIFTTFHSTGGAIAPAVVWEKIPSPSR